MHYFKAEAKRYDFSSNTITIHIFVKGLWDVHNIVAKIYEKDPYTLSRGRESSGEAQYGTTGYSYLDTPYGQ